jgi:hypothetical protein
MNDVINIIKNFDYKRHKQKMTGITAAIAISNGIINELD